MLLPLFIEKGLFTFKVLEANTFDRSITHMFTVLLFIANSNANPIIYTSRISTMKTYTLKLFGISTRVLSNYSSFGSQIRLNKSLMNLSDTKV